MLAVLTLRLEEGLKDLIRREGERSGLLRSVMQSLQTQKPASTGPESPNSMDEEETARTSTDARGASAAAAQYSRTARAGTARVPGGRADSSYLMSPVRPRASPQTQTGAGESGKLPAATRSGDVRPSPRGMLDAAAVPSGHVTGRAAAAVSCPGSAAEFVAGRSLEGRGQTSLTPSNALRVAAAATVASARGGLAVRGREAASSFKMCGVHPVRGPEGNDANTVMASNVHSESGMLWSSLGLTSQAAARRELDPDAGRFGSIDADDISANKNELNVGISITASGISTRNRRRFEGGSAAVHEIAGHVGGAAASRDAETAAQMAGEAGSQPEGVAGLEETPFNETAPASTWSASLPALGPRSLFPDTQLSPSPCADLPPERRRAAAVLVPTGSPLHRFDL